MKRRTCVFAIGIDEYEHYRMLSCCVNDAVAFLREIGRRADVSHRRLLVSGVDSDDEPTSAIVTSLLEEISNLAMTSNDIVFLYFAGHGFSTGGKDYFVCNDTVAGELEKAIATDDVIAALRKSKAGTAVMAVDACRSETDRAVGNFGERTAEFARRQGVVVMFGCSPGEVCQELPNLEEGHGIFTYSLVKAISELPHVTPLSLDRVVLDGVRDLCNQHKLTPQRPYTTVAPLQKAEFDLFSGEVISQEPKGSKKCILIVGPCHAGKTTLGQFLASELGFVHVEMSSFAWQRFMNRSPDYMGNLQDFMEDEVWRFNPYDIIVQDLLQAHEGLERLVVCGARRPEEIATIQSQNWDVFPIYLFANAYIRFQRHQNIESVSRYDLTYKDFVKRDLREYSWGLAKVGTMRGFELIENEHTIEELVTKSKSFLAL